jgi:hypothetical protein
VGVYLRQKDAAGEGLYTFIFYVFVIQKVSFRNLLSWGRSYAQYLIRKPMPLMMVGVFGMGLGDQRNAVHIFHPQVFLTVPTRLSIQIAGRIRELQPYVAHPTPTATSANVAFVALDSRQRWC